MYTAVIFDVDGTLIDSEETILNSLQKTLRLHYRREMSREELAFVLGIPGADALRQLGIEEVDRALHCWTEYMKEFRHATRVFDGIQELFEGLRGLPVLQGVVTSRTVQQFLDDFVPFGLLRDLPIDICADDTKRHKPHPEPLFKFLELSLSAPENSIYIGDTIYDYECARAAGVDFGLALWGCKDPDAVPAQYKFKQPADILSLFNRKP